jgi:excisionase family DNA binding protein
MGDAGVKKYLSPQELADELGVPINTVYFWRHMGTGPIGHKFGKLVRYAREDVDAWIASTRDDAA